MHCTAVNSQWEAMRGCCGYAGCLHDLNFLSLIINLFSGWLYDMTEDYRVPYLVTGGIEILGAVIVFFIAFMVHRQGNYQLNTYDSKRATNGAPPCSKVSSTELHKMSSPLADAETTSQSKGLPPLPRNDSFHSFGTVRSVPRYGRQDSRASYYRPRASSTSSTLSFA